MGELIQLSNSQISTVKQTVARELDGPEFDLFIALSRRTGLDPLRRQIIPIVFSANNPEKRKMETIVTRDGYRCIAARCGNYRPKSKPVQFVTDNTISSPINPAGLVSCTIELHMQDKQGQWHPVIGEAYWDEYAPLKEEWAYDQEKGKRLPTGKKTLEGNWGKMPRVMLEKCAESAALRAGWPEEFAGLYGEEEMAKAIVEDHSASEIVEIMAQERKDRAVNTKGKVPANFGDGIKYIEVGKYADAWLEKMRELSPSVILTLRDQNNECLREYWSKDSDGALALKAEFEKLEKELETQ